MGLRVSGFRVRWVLSSGLGVWDSMGFLVGLPYVAQATRSEQVVPEQPLFVDQGPCRETGCLSNSHVICRSLATMITG